VRCKGGDSKFLVYPFVYPSAPKRQKDLADLSAKSLNHLVGAAGFELATLCSQSRCATRLRYAPNVANSNRVAIKNDLVNVIDILASPCRLTQGGFVTAPSALAAHSQSAPLAHLKKVALQRSQLVEALHQWHQDGICNGFWLLGEVVLVIDLRAACFQRLRPHSARR
jgi:hypothetical protein